MSNLTHIGPDGRARMVDVSGKEITERVAVAEGFVQLTEQAFTLATSRDTKKGDPIAIAELAGIMAAKKTADIIPLCHPIALTNVTVKVEEADSYRLRVTASVKTAGKTGVEMEALTAASAACLTLYDMLKSTGHEMTIKQIALTQKSGGKSGDYTRDR